jgi:hypothetical protein
MSERAQALEQPVSDTVARINNEIAVGEDLGFQRTWWRFERAVWLFFVLLIGLDLLGVFGRGPLAHAQLTASDGSIDVHYERVERTGTPSMLTVTLGESAVTDGSARLFVSDSVVSGLGAQRIVPQPASTVVSRDGLTYTFPMTSTPGVIRFELQPSSAGHYAFVVGVPGRPRLRGGVVVVP